jgi:hypothetical protein
MNTYTNGDAAAILLNEGPGYAVQHYCDGNNFEDPVTRALWDTAGSALTALTAYISKQTGQEIN